jgi:hypothetical protein
MTALVICSSSNLQSFNKLKRISVCNDSSTQAGLSKSESGSLYITRKYRLQYHLHVALAIFDIMEKEISITKSDRS